jgi:hypothetical protein
MFIPFSKKKTIELNLPRPCFRSGSGGGFASSSNLFFKFAADDIATTNKSKTKQNKTTLFQQMTFHLENNVEYYVMITNNEFLKVCQRIVFSFLFFVLGSESHQQDGLSSSSSWACLRLVDFLCLVNGIFYNQDFCLILERICFVDPHQMTVFSADPIPRFRPPAVPIVSLILSFLKDLMSTLMIRSI